MKRWLRVVLPLLMLAGAAAGTVYLIRTRPRARERPRPPLSAQVDVLVATPAVYPARIRGMGTIVPAREVVLYPEVGGRIVRRHSNLEPGGRLAAGEEAVGIDPRDYEAAVDQAVAAMEKARFDLAMELGRKAVAEEEWKQLGGQVPTSEAGRSLALREPHLQYARAAVAAAESALGRARLNLERTAVRVPFDAVVLEKYADEGQVVGAQSRIARLAAVDAFWVQASLPWSELAWFDAPDEHGRDGAAARVIARHGNGRRTERAGRVHRVLAELEPAGRMARVLVEIARPLDRGSPEEVALALGAYVEVEIEGRPMRGVFEIPRDAVREGDRLWIMNAQDVLEIRPVTILRRLPESVIVESGLAAGERVVVSQIPLPVPGMKLRRLGIDGGGATPPAAQ